MYSALLIVNAIDGINAHPPGTANLSVGEEYRDRMDSIKALIGSGREEKKKKSNSIQR